jgi:hypothetical protein
MTTRYRRQSMDSLTQISDVDYCNECEQEKQILCCEKCAESVCIKGKCSLTFPHYNDTLYVICRTCTKKIENKLLVLVDLDKLVLLKKKIKKLQQENRKLRHSV